MYRTCIFCSADLGSNEVVESFPVGTRVAFDSWRGRLWAVCRKCGRWNLAPIEERWEAVEAAEKRFADTRQRVQSENIGLARMRDGTRLIRIGQAMPGELAAWRYGQQLLKRRHKEMIGIGGLIVVGGAVAAGLPFMLAAGVPLTVFSSGLQLISTMQVKRSNDTVVYRMDPASSPTGLPIEIRRRHMWGSTLTRSGDALAVRLAPSMIMRRGWLHKPQPTDPSPGLVVEGAGAERLAARAMVNYNHRGANEKDVATAIDLLDRAGGAAEYVRALSAQEVALGRLPVGSAPRPGPRPSFRAVAGSFRGDVIQVQRYRDPFSIDERAHLEKSHALALEMALHEESERAALEGELAALEEAWREAESIARIADALPDEPPE